MSLNSIAEIQFPVFLIGNEKPQELDGVLFFHKETNKGESITIVDDKNNPAPTLGLRRIGILAQGGSLARLATAIFFLGDLIKLAKPTKWFIDSNGNLFNYIKSTRAQLIIKPIKQVIHNSNAGIIIEVEGVQTRFKCLYAPNHSKFAGLLKIGRMYILYGLYEEPHKDTWKLI